VSLAATSGGSLDLSELAASLAVVYVYPRTGIPGIEPPPGWNETPGARGCTPQSCGFRDHFAELNELGAQVVGLSSQTIAEQLEFAERERLPYPLLADPDLALVDALGLPTFEFDGASLYKRMALILAGSVVEHVFYPVFPPDRNAADVVAWLRDRAAAG
jgi:peroxiredoxin